jgi:uncharacterized protein (DUF2147 family)
VSNVVDERKRVHHFALASHGRGDISNALVAADDIVGNNKVRAVVFEFFKQIGIQTGCVGNVLTLSGLGPSRLLIVSHDIAVNSDRLSSQYFS